MHDDVSLNIVREKSSAFLLTGSFEIINIKLDSFHHIFIGQECLLDFLLVAMTILWSNLTWNT